eukprot:6210050-Pleurochrysis_carterae.AAC.5
MAVLPTETAIGCVMARTVAGDSDERCTAATKRSEPSHRKRDHARKGMSSLMSAAAAERAVRGQLIAKPPPSRLLAPTAPCASPGFSSASTPSAAMACAKTSATTSVKTS